MIIYPNPDSWDEFYPSEIFIAMTKSDTDSAYLPILKKANIGATIVVGESGSTTMTYKKVGDIEAAADLDTSLIFLGRVTLGPAE